MEISPFRFWLFGKGHSVSNGVSLDANANAPPVSPFTNVITFDANTNGLTFDANANVSVFDANTNA